MTIWVAKTKRLQLHKMFFFCRPDAPVCPTTNYGQSIQLKHSSCNKQNSFPFSLIFIFSEVNDGQPNLFVSMSLLLTDGDDIEPTVSVRCLGIRGIIPARVLSKQS